MFCANGRSNVPRASLASRLRRRKAFRRPSEHHPHRVSTCADCGRRYGRRSRCPRQDRQTRQISESTSAWMSAMSHFMYASKSSDLPGGMSVPATLTLPRNRQAPSPTVALGRRRTLFNTSQSTKTTFLGNDPPLRLIDRPPNEAAYSSSVSPITLPVLELTRCT